MFKLSKRSLSNLEGVDERLVQVVHDAIKITDVDFGVIEGLRTLERQSELVAKGASWTMKSKHINGLAVDLMAYIGSRGSWELPLYFSIAEAIREASKGIDVPVRWGAAWTVESIVDWDGSMVSAMDSYVDLRRSQGRRPTIDGPHFELMV